MSQNTLLPKRVVRISLILTATAFVELSLFGILMWSRGQGKLSMLLIAFVCPAFCLVALGVAAGLVGIVRSRQQILGELLVGLVRCFAVVYVLIVPALSVSDGSPGSCLA